MRDWLLVRPGNRDYARYQKPTVKAAPDDLDEIKDKISAHDEALEKLCERISKQKYVGPQSGYRIACAVAKAHGLTFRELISRRRYRELVHARWHAMWEIKNATPMSSPEIARLLGNLDHTTVLYGIKRHQQRLDKGEI